MIVDLDLDVLKNGRDFEEVLEVSRVEINGEQRLDVKQRIDDE